MDQQCSATVKHWTLSTYGHNSCSQLKSRLISPSINDRLSVNHILLSL